MTEQEAINVFKGFKFTPREMKAVAMGIEALEKQIPKKPIQLKGYKKPCFCPICIPSDNTFVKCSYEHDTYNYCPMCGQRIDWGNEE